MCPSCLFLQFLKDTWQPAHTLMGSPSFLGIPESVLTNFFSWDLVYCFETNLPIVLECFTFLRDTGFSQIASTGSLLYVLD